MLLHIPRNIKGGSGIATFFPVTLKNGFWELWPNALRYGPEIFTEGSSQKVLGGVFFLFSKFDL